MHCALCSGWARFVLRHDAKGMYRLLPAQSPLGRARHQLANGRPELEDLLHQPREDRGLVTRACADLEDACVLSQCKRLGHRGNHVGLRDRLPLPDRQRPIGIGQRPVGRVDEFVPRHGAHRLEHARVGHTA